VEYLPLFFKLSAQQVLVVGGGTVAARKIRLLLRSGAVVRVVSPKLCTELEDLASAGKIEWLQTHYSSSHLDGTRLVVAATNDHPLNKRIYEDATEISLPVNVVDAPELCSVIFPSIVDRNPILIAISSSGRSPVLARILRRKIEALVPAAYGRLAEFSGRLRERVKKSIPEETPRRLFWEQALEGTIGESVLAGREQDAANALEEQLANTQGLYKGEVYLVGAGPGDPDLLTFKAARLLQSADVVLYDRLVSPEILEMARRDAQRIYVGKRRSDHAVPQTEINQLLLELAQSGKRVIRLKGGDPFIFGRGGEEIELLAQHNVPFQVVPGITAANGAASYAGIPLTHRDHAQSVRFVAGYLKGDSVDHDWAQFTSPTETLVFYMGLQGLPQICQKLRDAGREQDTPVALIEKATTTAQRVLTGTLSTIAGVVERENPKAPTLLIIGDVVTLQQELAWFGEQDSQD
jgi:uroporphyrin-III C-methyltransferase / precorrin-2 dehydrogenase / sirohydrochlorin ferrochelatase